MQRPERKFIGTGGRQLLLFTDLPPDGLISDRLQGAVWADNSALFLPLWGSTGDFWECRFIT